MEYFIVLITLFEIQLLFNFFAHVFAIDIHKDWLDPIVKRVYFIKVPLLPLHDIITVIKSFFIVILLNSISLSGLHDDSQKLK
jgi:hypothetical protein